ncbi:prolipoprotein diacylglyceryl transferase [Sodalis-like secondary symbiont of Drepanosiphum platanoidis]|uniref:prolipoprotein diacylglyceryl transferase n=1 Tax=Sodalis-like secondary symbiont of Drepanosiphum platanoidis TaxID=2994493 RepID=UPI003463A469
MIKKYFIFPSINPIIYSIGSINFRWYGLMYIIGFFFIFFNSKKKIYKLKIKFSKKKIDDLLYYGFLGALIGGRLGYILFYNINFFLKNPLNIFYIYNGGMSFHGGLIGVIFIIFKFSKKNKNIFFSITDIISPLIPFSLGLGRIGNFINCELIGRITLNTPWAILFTNSQKEDLIAIKNSIVLKKIYKIYGSLPRHPSQIYEFILEGVLLFIILNIYKNKKNNIGKISSLFLIIYSIFRIFIEFFRQPDIQLGLFFNFLSIGQILTFPMLIIGTYIFLKK